MTDLYYRRSPEALHADVGNDVVALHIRNGRCFGMEHVTADVWRLLEQPVTQGQICSKLLDEYDVDAETCRTEIAGLLEIMRREGLIEPVVSQENAH